MWDKLKKILQISGGRGVIIEDGEPRYVILPVDEYIQLKDGAERTQEVPQQPHQPQQNQAPEPSQGYPYSSPASVDLSDIDMTDVEMDVDPREYQEGGRDEGISLDDLPLA